MTYRIFTLKAYKGSTLSGPWFFSTAPSTRVPQPTVLYVVPQWVGHIPIHLECSSPKNVHLMLFLISFRFLYKCLCTEVILDHSV